MAEGMGDDMGRGRGWHVKKWNEFEVPWYNNERQAREERQGAGPRVKVLLGCYRLVGGTVSVDPEQTHADVLLVSLPLNVGGWGVTRLDYYPSFLPSFLIISHHYYHASSASHHHDFTQQK